MSLRLSSIPQELIGRLPESVARENCVIPIDASDDTLTIAAPPEDKAVVSANDFASLCQAALSDVNGLQAKLEFILQCNVRLEVHSAKDIKTAIDQHYSYDASIANCTWSIPKACPQTWFNLQSTGQQDVRFCDICSKHVYYCQSNESVVKHGALGHCVAFYNGLDKVETIGDVSLESE